MQSYKIKGTFNFHLEIDCQQLNELSNITITAFTNKQKKIPIMCKYQWYKIYESERNKTDTSGNIYPCSTFDIGFKIESIITSFEEGYEGQAVIEFQRIQISNPLEQKLVALCHNNMKQQLQVNDQHWLFSMEHIENSNNKQKYQYQDLQVLQQCSNQLQILCDSQLYKFKTREDRDQFCAYIITIQSLKRIHLKFIAYNIGKFQQRTVNFQQVLSSQIQQLLNQKIVLTASIKRDIPEKYANLADSRSTNQFSQLQNQISQLLTEKQQNQKQIENLQNQLNRKTSIQSTNQIQSPSKDQLEGLDKLIQSLKSELYQVKQRESDLMQQNSRLTLALNELSEKKNFERSPSQSSFMEDLNLKLLQEKLEQCTYENNKLQEELKNSQKQGQLEKLTKSNQKMAEEISNQAQQIQDLQIELQLAKNASRMSMSMSITEDPLLKQKLVQVEQENDYLKKKIQILEEDINRKKAQPKQAKGEKEKDQQILILSEANKRLMDENLRQYEQLRQLDNSSQNNSSIRESKYQDLGIQQQMEEQISRMQVTHNAEINKMKNKIEKLQRDLTDNHNLKKQVDQLTKQNKRLVEENANLADQVKNMGELNKSFTDSLAQSQLFTNNDQVKIFEKEIYILQQTNAELQTKLEKSLFAQTQLQEKLRNLEKQIKSEQESKAGESQAYLQILQLKQDLVNKQEIVFTLEREIDQLKSHREPTSLNNQEIAILKQQLSQRDQELKQAQSQLKLQTPQKVEKQQDNDQQTKLLQEQINRLQLTNQQLIQENLRLQEMTDLNNQSYSSISVSERTSHKRIMLTNTIKSNNKEQQNQFNKIIELENKIDYLTSENKLFKNEIQGYKDERVYLQKKLEENEEISQNYRRKLNQLQQELESERLKLISRVNDDQQKLQTKINQLQLENDKLLKQQDLSNRQIEYSSEQNYKITQCQQQISEKDIQINEATRKLQNQIQLNITKENKLNENNQAILNLQREIQKLQEKQSNVIQDQEQKQKLTLLQEHVNRLNITNQQLVQENLRLQEMADQHNQSFSSISSSQLGQERLDKSNKCQFQSKKSMLTNFAYANETKMTKFIDDPINSQQQSQGISSNMNNDELMKMQQQVDQLKFENEQLNHKISYLQASINEKDIRFSEINKKLQNEIQFQQKNENQLIQNNILIKQLQQENQQLQQQQQSLQQKNKQLETSCSQLFQLQSQKEENMQIVSRLEDQLKNKDLKLQNIISIQNENQSTIQTLTQKNQQLQQQLQDWELQFQQLSRNTEEQVNYNKQAVLKLEKEKINLKAQLQQNQYEQQYIQTLQEQVNQAKLHDQQLVQENQNLLGNESDNEEQDQKLAQQKIINLQEELQEKDLQLQNLRTRLRNEIQYKIKKENKLNENNLIIEQLQTKNQQLQQQFQQQQQQFQQQQQQQQNLHLSQEKEIQINQLKDEIQEVNFSNKILKEENQQLKGVKKMNEQQIQEFEKLQTKFSDQKKENEKIQNQLNDKNQFILALQNENQKLQQQTIRLQTDFAYDSKLLEEQIQKLKQSSLQLYNENKQLREANQQQIQGNDQEQEKIHQIQQEKSKIEQQCQQLKEKIQSQEKQINQLTQSNQQMFQQNQQLENSVNQLNQTNKYLEEKLNEREDNLQKMNNKLQETTQLQIANEKKLVENNSVIQTLIMEKNQLSQQKQDLQSQLQQQQDQLQYQNIQNSNCQQQNDLLDNFKKEICNLKTQNEKLVQDNSRLADLMKIIQMQDQNVQQNEDTYLLEQSTDEQNQLYQLLENSQNQQQQQQQLLQVKLEKSQQIQSDLSEQITTLENLLNSQQEQNQSDIKQFELQKEQEMKQLQLQIQLNKKENENIKKEFEIQIKMMQEQINRLILTNKSLTEENLRLNEIQDQLNQSSSSICVSQKSSQKNKNNHFSDSD